jgi:hypothetical protein
MSDENPLPPVPNIETPEPNTHQEALGILELLEKDKHKFITHLLKLRKMGKELDMEYYFDLIVNKLNVINKRIAQKERILGIYEGKLAKHAKGGSRKSRNNRRATRRR